MGYRVVGLYTQKQIYAKRRPRIVGIMTMKNAAQANGVRTGDADI